MGWIASLGYTSSAPNGSAINVADTNPNRYINILKSGQWSSSATASQFASAQLDDNQYPTQSFTGVLPFTFPTGAFVNVPYRFIWSAGTKGQWTFVGSNTSVTNSGTGGSFTGGTGNNLTVTVDGTGAGYIIFTPSSLSIQFVGTGSWGSAGTAQIFLVRDSDVTNGDYAAGKIFTREYIALLSGLNAKTIRVMGQMLKGNGSENNQVKWAYRTQTSTLTWGGSKIFSALWSGGYGASGQITGTDQLTAAPSTSIGLGAWVNGETVQGQILNDATKINITGASSNGGNVQLLVNSTAALTPAQSIWVNNVLGTTEANGIQTILTVDDATHVTINVPFVHAYSSGGTIGIQTLTVTGKSGGTKFICSTSGIPVRQNFDTFYDSNSSGLVTFTYDALLDRVRAATGGVHAYPPASVLANLANSVNANLWATIPWYADDDWVTQWSGEILNNLRYSLYFYPEWGNEVGWSFQFPASQWVTQVAGVLGFSNAVHGYYALRTRQVMEIIGTVWLSRKERLRRVLAYQGAQGESTTLNVRMKGSLLSSYGYNTTPNRPIDFCEVIAFAPYAGGTNYSMGTDISNNAAPTSQNASFFQSVIDAWDAGNTSGAIALVDADIRSGRTAVFNVTGSGTTFTTVDGGGTPTAHGWVGPVNIAFSGATYTGVTTSDMYLATITGTNTFTVQKFANGFATGSAISTGTTTGTMNAGIVGRNSRNITNMFALNSTMYQAAEWLAASMDGDRPAGMANVRTEQYEGNLEPVGPTMAHCATIGLTSANSSLSFTGDTTSSSATIRNISSSLINGMIVGAAITGTNITGTPTITAIDTINFTITISSGAAVTGTGTGVSLALSGSGAIPASNLQQALIAWKNDPMAAATQTLYFQQSMGLDAGNTATFGKMLHARTPSQLVLLGGGAYALVSGPGINDPKWKMYDGFAAFNSGLG